MQKTAKTSLTPIYRKEIQEDITPKRAEKKEYRQKFATEKFRHLRFEKTKSFKVLDGEIENSLNSEKTKNTLVDRILHGEVSKVLHRVGEEKTVEN